MSSTEKMIRIPASSKIKDRASKPYPEVLLLFKLVPEE
jgi:hypothetical protein